MSWDVFDRRYKQPRVKQSHLKLMERMVERDRKYEAARKQREEASATASAESS